MISKMVAVTSSAMIVVAPATLAAMMAERPTAPVSLTMMLDPADTWSESRTVPAPVWMPQPRGPTSSIGTSVGILTALRELMIAWVANEDWPKNDPLTGSPAGVVMVPEPSSRAPLKFSAMKLRQYASRPVRQFAQWPQEANEAATWSPTLTSVTFSPTCSTMAAPS
ncbi:MAG: hypothetical protein ABWX74_17990 [Aeromicrobium sp.]